MDNFELGTSITIDLGDIEEFVYGDNFKDFILSNTTDISTALFVFQTLTDKIDELKK